MNKLKEINDLINETLIRLETQFFIENDNTINYYNNLKNDVPEIIKNKNGN